MNILKNKAIWIVCSLSFISALLFNQLNLNKIPDELKRENQTIRTSDDASYLNPPTNYLVKGEWKDNGFDTQSYFIRTPGYGLFYMVFLKFAGYPLALTFLKIAQLLLFSFSVYWLFSITLSLVNNKKIALITAAIYGITPFAVGFLSYTLTEGITPALVLLFVFLLFRAEEKTTSKHKFIFYFFSALTFAYLLIVRPPLGFMGILLPVFIFKDYWKEGATKTIMKLVLFGLIASSFMAVWQIRNYNIAKEYVGLHAIYYADNNSIYRPTFKEYWNFVGGWAQEGRVVHSYMVPMWKAAIKGDTSQVYIDNAIATFPKKVVNHFGKERLTTVFRKYQTATLLQKSYYDQKLPMPLKTSQIELEVIDELKQLTSEYKRAFWFHYYLVSSLKVFKTMVFHSNLSMYIFQNTYRGNLLMEMVRIVFYGLHILCFLGLIVGLFFNKSNWKQHIILLTVFAYIFYLCYFQRGIEERYTLPILPLLLISLGVLLNQFNTRLRRQS